MADDMGFGIALKLVGAFALAGAASIGFTIYDATNRYAEHKQENQAIVSMTARAQESLRGKSLTVTTLDKFKKSSACDASHPYGAAFVAQDAGNKVIYGHICSSPDRESVITFGS